MKHFVLFFVMLLVHSFLIAQDYETDWVKGSPASHLGTQNIATDSRLNIYSIGHFKTTMDFDPGPGVYNLSPIDSTDCFILKLDSAGNFQWVIPIGGLRSIYIYAISTDTDDNIIVAGTFSGTVDFDPSPASDVKFSVGDFNTFIAKFDQSGNLIWSKQLEGRSSIREMSINTDNKIFITGYFQDTVDFDPSAAEHRLVGNSGYLLSLKADGSFNFCKEITHNEGAAIYYLKISKDNKILLGGVLSSLGTVDLDPSSSDYLISGIGSFVAYYSDSGTFEKALFFKGISVPDPSNNYISVKDYVTDNEKSLYLTGTFFGNADFDISTDSFKLNGDKYGDAFVMKYDSSGKFIWAKSIGDNLSDGGSSICLDKFSNIYIGGKFTGTPDFDPGAGTHFAPSYGGEDLFILHLSGTGNFKWVKIVGGSGFDYQEGLVLDAQENLIQSGMFQNTIYFDSLGHNSLVSTSPNSSYFLHKLKKSTLSHKEYLVKNDILLYPNPSKGELNLDFNGLEMHSLRVLDLLGRIIYQQSGTFRNEITINLRENGLKGIYFFEAISEKGASFFHPIIFE